MKTGVIAIAEDAEPAPPRPAARSALLPAATALAVAGILLLRDPGAVLSPVLHCEDGRDVFAFYYHHREWQAVLRFYAGYLSLLPNLLGYVSIWLPTVWIPTFLSAVPMALAGFALSLFSWPRFRSFLPSDRARALVCIALAAWPVGNYALVSNTMYSIWSLLLALLLLSVARLPRTPIALGAQLGFMMLAICSHPMSVIVAPWLALRALTEARLRNRAAFLLLLVVLGLYLVFGVESQGIGGTAPLDALRLAGRLVSERVVSETILGLHGRLVLGQVSALHVHAVSTAAVLTLLGAAGALRHRLSRGEWILIGFALYVIVALSLGFAMGRSAAVGLEPEWGHRYSYLQRLFFGLVVVVLASSALRAHGRRVAVASGLAALVYFGVLNHYNNRYYENGDERGVEVRRFVVDLEAARRALQPGETRPLRLERGVWTIEIELRSDRESPASDSRPEAGADQR